MELVTPVQLVERFDDLVKRADRIAKFRILSNEGSPIYLPAGDQRPQGWLHLRIYDEKNTGTPDKIIRAVFGSNPDTGEIAQTFVSRAALESSVLHEDANVGLGRLESYLIDAEAVLKVTDISSEQV